MRKTTSNSRERKCKIESTRNHNPKRFEEYAPTFGSKNPDYPHKIQSAFLPSPREKCMINPNHEIQEANENDESSLWTPIGQFESPWDISSFTNDSFQNNKILQSIIQNANMTAKYKAPAFIIPNENDRKGSKNTSYSSRVEGEGIQPFVKSDNMHKLAKEWVNQELPHWPQNSKFADTSKHTGFGQGFDSMGRAVYRTLEVSEELNSSWSQVYNRIRSEDRLEKKRKRSKNKKCSRYNLDDHRQRAPRGGRQEYYHQNQQYYNIQHGLETEVAHGDTDHKFSFDRALSCDIKSDKGDHSYSIENTNPNHKKLRYYDTMKSQEFGYLAKNHGIRNVSENSSKNQLRMLSCENKEDVNPANLKNSAYEEYLKFKNISSLRTKTNPLLTGFVNTKASREFQQQVAKTDKGLFTNNERINSKKQYFHKFGESLNRESLDWSRSTLNDKEANLSRTAHANARKPQYDQNHSKKSFFSQVLPNNRFGQ